VAKAHMLDAELLRNTEASGGQPVRSSSQAESEEPPAAGLKETNWEKSGVSSEPSRHAR